MPQITHAFVSAKLDSVDPTLVQPSDWNAIHLLTAQEFAATAGQTVFTPSLAPLTGVTWVFLNGLKQREGALYDFTITSTQIIFNTGLQDTDFVEIIS